MTRIDRTESRPGVRRRVTIAHAHSGKQAYVYLRADARRISGNVQFPVADLNEILGLELALTKEEGSEALPESEDAIRAYTADHLAMDVDSHPVKIEMLDCRFIEPKSGAYVVTEYQVTDPAIRRPVQVKVAFDGLIEAKPERDGLLMMFNIHGWGRFTHGEEERFSFDAETATHIIDLPRPSFGQNVSAGARKVSKTISARLAASG